MSVPQRNYQQNQHHSQQVKVVVHVLKVLASFSAHTKEKVWHPSKSKTHCFLYSLFFAVRIWKSYPSLRALFVFNTRKSLFTIDKIKFQHHFQSFTTSCCTSSLALCSRMQGLVSKTRLRRGQRLTKAIIVTETQGFFFLNF